ncbi:MAG: aminotransferase class I/II-fold pyridoxal phosphate-dependent enzyme [Spirochaetales bacterium]|nr:aminotransferase class I/II-fold pyridoxal phosphate-dependent enzyme [Spirochaetales bacterium]
MADDAEKLNSVLGDSIGGRLLSETGRRFFFPHGIVYQCAQASEHSWKYNASSGIACINNEPIETEVLRTLLPMLNPGETVSYAPTSGEKKLTELWKKEILAKNPSLKETNISRPVLVPGLTNGIAQSAKLFVNPGDIAIMPDLHWGNYRLIFSTDQRAKLCTYPMFDKNNRFNVGGMINAALQSGSRKLCFIFNFPHNPSGYSPENDTVKKCLDSLTSLAGKGHDILCICDDSYFGLFYEDDVYRESLFSALSDAHENILAVKVDGATKEHFFWGMRIGFITFGSAGLSADQHAALEEKTTGLIRASVSSSSRIAQSLLYKVLSDNDYAAQKNIFMHEMEKRYRKVRTIIAKYMDSCLDILPFNSGYFICLKTPGDADLLRRHLLFEKGIGTVSFGDCYLRIAWSRVDEENLSDLFAEVFESAEKIYR